MFDHAILSDIRDHISVVSLIGERVQLKKAGRNYKGLCPFHHEKTPSFMVSDEKQIFHCFGCGEGGDIFKFTMKYEGLSFAEAVQELAGRAGVTLPKNISIKNLAPDAEITRKKKWCYRINQIAMEYFSSTLNGSSGEKARDYLTSRKINFENFTQLFLGYAEKNWEGLVKHFESRKVPLELAYELGLLKKRTEGGYYDFFRDRLMFPIISSRNEVIGFSGRALEDSEDTAKYINSPDSIIYHKSNSVYGLNLACDEIRKKDQAILVEGNIDLVSLYQAGIKNVVAPLGTALTSGHIRLISRFSKNMVLVYDGDNAGSKAAIRALPLFLEMELVARASRMPKEEDPDSFIKKFGREKFAELVDSAPTLFEHAVDLIAEDLKSDTASKIEALRQITPLLKQVENSAERGLYKVHTAKRLKVREDIIEDALKRQGRQTSFGERRQTAAAAYKYTVTGHTSAERLLIETMVKKPEFAKVVAARIESTDFTDQWCKTVAEIIFSNLKNGQDLNVTNLLDNVADQDLADALCTIAVEEIEMEEVEIKELVEDCIKAIKLRPVVQTIEQVNEQIKEAEAKGDENRLFELLAKKRDLAATIAR